MVYFMGAAASFWSVMGFLAVIKNFIPREFYQFLEDLRTKLTNKVSQDYSVEIQYENDLGLNQLYTSTHRYLGTLAHRSTTSVEARCSPNKTDIQFGMSPSQELWDEYKGIALTWTHNVVYEEPRRERGRTRTRKSFELKVRKKYKQVVDEYLSFILQRGQDLALEDQEKRLYTNMKDYWTSVTFNSPATFETVAMEPGTKKMLIKDLIAFKNGKEFYHGVGRPWKRGYLLYGPPGTGKSSLISAIANFTGYDVYDLELTKVSSNTQLRQLLITMTDRAIVVVEDIDCSLELKNRIKKQKADETSDNDGEQCNISEVTLSGFLNFTDGLWSSCGSEKIFIFTTNHIDKLDPALLRPGRMDVKVYMSWCSFEVFKLLGSNYLKVSDHEMFPEVEKLLKYVKITPASLIEVLLEHHADADVALERLVEVLKEKKLEVTGPNEGDDFCDMSSFSSGEIEAEEVAR